MADRLQEYAQELLLRTMKDYNEYHWWSSGWLDGLEYDLWSFVCGDVDSMWDTSFGRGLKESDRDRLLTLAVDAGGWYYWSENKDDVLFIPMAKWLDLYDAHKLSLEGS